MKSQWIMGVVGLFGLMGIATGCATTGSVVDAKDVQGVAVAQTEGVRAGHFRVLDTDINPRVPVRLTAERRTAPETGGSRVVLRDGKFVVCWRRGSAESGYQLVAQAWTAGGTKLGQAVVISPVDADVFGPPELVAIDGKHAVATFAAMSGTGFETLAVPLEVL